VIAEHGLVDDTVAFIQKPFSIRDLAAKVRETLDRQSRQSPTARLPLAIASAV